MQLNGNLFDFNLILLNITHFFPRSAVFTCAIKDYGTGRRRRGKQCSDLLTLTCSHHFMLTIHVIIYFPSSVRNFYGVCFFAAFASCSVRFSLTLIIFLYVRYNLAVYFHVCLKFALIFLYVLLHAAAFYFPI